MSAKPFVLDLTSVAALSQAEIDNDVCLDALIHVGGGGMGSFERVATQADGSSLFVDDLLRTLEVLGHVDVRRDDRCQPVEWEVSPAQIAELSDGRFLLTGAWAAASRASFAEDVSGLGGKLEPLSGAEKVTSWVVSNMGLGDVEVLASAYDVDVAPDADLADAIAAVIEGKSIANPVTDVVGCEFEATKLLTETPDTATWSRDVAPIVFANCATCHRPGEAAPFSLMTYEDAAKHAKMIASVTEDRVMPPWKPSPGFGHLEGERRLTDRDIAVLRKWADNGAPAGEMAKAPAAPVVSDRLGARHAGLDCEDARAVYRACGRAGYLPGVRDSTESTGR